MYEVSKIQNKYLRVPVKHVEHPTEALTFPRGVWTMLYLDERTTAKGVLSGHVAVVVVCWSMIMTQQLDV